MSGSMRFLKDHVWKTMDMSVCSIQRCSFNVHVMMVHVASKCSFNDYVKFGKHICSI